MTPYSLLRQACGLSQSEAASLRGVRVDTVKSWDTGRRDAPDQAIEQLRNLYGLIVEKSGQIADHINDFVASRGEALESIEVGYPADDHEAQALGLPCVGAWRAMAGMVLVELTVNVKLVPRGSTVATAAAMDAAGR